MALPSWLLLLACALCGAFSVGSTSAEQAAESRLYVFSSLQKGDDATTPPYPVGMQLSLTCQTADNRNTYWFEKKNGSNELVELPSESDSVKGVHWSVYNIPHLKMTDHGREFICMKDSSTMEEIVNLVVVDKPAPVEISTSFDPQVEAEITCVAEGLSAHLELCWYKGNEKIHCQVPGRTSPSTQTAVTVHVGLPGILEETHTYLCKPQLRADINTDSLTQATLSRFATMFAEVSKELHMVSQVFKPTNETDRKKTNTPSNEITTTTTATRSLVITSTITSTTSAPSTTLLPSSTGATFNVTHPSVVSRATTNVTPPSATSRSTTENYPWTHTLLIITAALLLCLVFTSITSVILVVKLRQTRTSVQNVYADSQGAPNGNQFGSAPPGDDPNQARDIARWPDEGSDGISHIPVRVNQLASGQCVPQMEYPGAVDTSYHRWPGEGVPLGHAYYYPGIIERIREEISNGTPLLTSGMPRGGVDRTVDSTLPCNTIHHSYHYPVLTEEMKRLLSKSSVNRVAA